MGFESSGAGAISTFVLPVLVLWYSHEIFQSTFIMMGNCQVVRHRTLTPVFVGSNPAYPTIWLPAPLASTSLMKLDFESGILQNNGAAVAGGRQSLSYGPCIKTRK